MNARLPAAVELAGCYSSLRSSHLWRRPRGGFCLLPPRSSKSRHGDLAAVSDQTQCAAPEQRRSAAPVMTPGPKPLHEPRTKSGGKPPHSTRFANSEAHPLRAKRMECAGLPALSGSWPLSRSRTTRPLSMNLSPVGRGSCRAAVPSTVPGSPGGSLYRVVGHRMATGRLSAETGRHSELDYRAIMRSIRCARSRAVSTSAAWLPGCSDVAQPM